MGTADGKIIGVTKIVDNGDPAERFNLVLVAEGYRESELTIFAGDAFHFVTGLFSTPPFSSHQCAINVWRLDVASDESGADDPAGPCGGTGAMPRTYFDARFCDDGLPRALVCDTSLVLSTVMVQVPQFHSAQVIVNSSRYGGTGGVVGVSSTATVKDNGEPVDWREIVIHEMGHSIFGLADEYYYYAGCDEFEPSQNHYAGPEPSQPNITKSPTATGKWDDLINTSTLPTWSNLNCGQCPPEPGTPGGPADNAIVVGTFEGAYYRHCGVYRPQASCKMRKLGAPFCDVCHRVISEFLDPYDPPLCIDDLKIDLTKWVAVATILFGVIQDGGGVVIVGGKPIPIDPWGPLRHSLWAALADPQRAQPAMRDVIVGTALQQIVSLVSEADLRAELDQVAGKLVDQAAAKLPQGTIR